MRHRVVPSGLLSPANRRAFLGALAGLAVSPAAAKPGKACAGPFSSRGELQDLVNASRPGSTVRLCAGTFTDTGFTVGRNLTIVGAGAEETVLQGRNAATDSAVTIVSGVKVALKGLTITNDAMSGNDSKGGGIFNEGKLTLTACAVSGCFAHDGGGIYNADDATLVLNDSEVFQNSATLAGGGIASRKNTTLTLNDSVVTDNEAAWGGGISTGPATAVLNSSKVTGNRADLGGGIDNFGVGGTLEVRRGSVIGGNGGAGNSARSGAGVYNENATATFAKGTRVTGNSHSGGNGIGAGIANDSGTVILADTNIVTGNLPTNCGGLPTIPNCVD